MDLRIDPKSGLPIYLQIIEQVKLAIAAGTISPGQQLPSVRQLSVDLRVNPNTIAKAYNLMEIEGLIHTRRGEGTFVSERDSKILEKSQEEIIEKIIKELVDTARKFKISQQDITKKIRDEFIKDEFDKKGR